MDLELAKKEKCQENTASSASIQHFCPGSLAQGPPLQKRAFSKTLSSCIWTKKERLIRWNSGRVLVEQRGEKKQENPLFMHLF